MNFLLRVLINALPIGPATRVVGGRDVSGGAHTTTTVLVFVVVALVFGIVNAVVKPIVKLLSLPLFILTLGLFTLVVNGAMLWLVGWLSERTEYGLRVEDFWSALIGALIVSIVSLVLNAAFKTKK